MLACKSTKLYSIQPNYPHAYCFNILRVISGSPSDFIRIR